MKNQKYNEYYCPINLQIPQFNLPVPVLTGGYLSAAGRVPVKDFSAGKPFFRLNAITGALSPGIEHRINHSQQAVHLYPVSGTQAAAFFLAAIMNMVKHVFTRAQNCLTFIKKRIVY